MRACQSLGIPAIRLDSRNRIPFHERGLTCVMWPVWSEQNTSNAKILIPGSDTLPYRSRSYVQVQSSSVAQAACHLELWDCCSFGCRGPDHFMVAGASFGRCSRVTLSLRRHVECVVRGSRARIARDRRLRSRFLLLRPVSDPFVWCTARRNTTPCHIHAVSPVCRLAERCRKERPTIAQAHARCPTNNS